MSVQVDLLPTAIFKTMRLCQKSILPSMVKLRGVGGADLHVKGCCRFVVLAEMKPGKVVECAHRFHVVDEAADLYLLLATMRMLGMVGEDFLRAGSASVDAAACACLPSSLVIIGCSHLNAYYFNMSDVLNT